jgi:hypothetical protein
MYIHNIYIYFAYTYVYIYTHMQCIHIIYIIYRYIYICIYITISSRSDMERLSLKAHSFNVHGSQKLAPQGHSDARGPMRAKVQNLRGKKHKVLHSDFHPTSEFMPCCHSMDFLYYKLPAKRSCHTGGIQLTAWHFSDSKPFKISKPDPRSFKIIQCEAPQL